MKKRKLVLAVLATLTIGLTGCTPSDNPDTPVDPDDPVVENYFIQEPTTITLWSTIGDNNQPYIEQYIESFKEIEPNVTIENVQQSGSYDDLAKMVVTGFAANNYPDLIQAYPDAVSDFLSYDKVVNLDSYIDNEDYGWTADEKADYVQAYLDEGANYSIEGTYSMPFSKSTECMFYNEDILLGLDLSGIDPEINNGNRLNADYLNNLTWEELFGHLAPALERYNSEVKQIITPRDGVSSIVYYDSDDNLFITLTQQYEYPYTAIDENGVGEVLFNTPEMQDLMLEWRDYVADGYLLTSGLNNSEYGSNYFTAGATLFSIGSSAGVKYQFSAENPMNIGVSRLPQHEGGNKAIIQQGPSLAVLDHDDENRALASWLFYKHMTNEENSLTWALNSGYTPIRESNYSDPAYIEANDIESKPERSLERVMAATSLYYGTISDYLYTTPAFKGSGEIRQQVGGLLTNCLLPTNSADQIPDFFQEAENLSKIAVGE